MINFSNFYSLLNEGGAGGHMPHPFDLPNINTGKDLTRVFENAITHTAGRAVMFADSGNTYIFVSDGDDGVDAADALIELTGFDASSATMTISGGDIFIV